MMLSETRERFVRAILAQVPADEIVEIHFFAPIKQSGIESGVAVVAVDHPVVVPEASETDVAPALDAAPAPEEMIAEAPMRYTVYTARYRLTLKGPDRGKWETSVVAEADAPLLTVDAVVRGVQRRSGDAEDPERMSGDELRSALGMHSESSQE